MTGRRCGVRWCALLLAAFLAPACSGPNRLPAVPVEVTDRAEVPGIPDARFFPDTNPEALLEDFVEALGRERALLTAEGRDPADLPPISVLAISGGGEDGAFGAGLLVGWSERGDRPEFKGVTGISTGALTAPFAFLGPAYDDALRAVYTQISADEVFTERSLLAAVNNDAMADTSPLRETVGRYVTEEFLDEIAAEHQKGRLLYIATTNIDAERPVIWNMGEIAESGAPGALELFKSILLASAAIPGFFPPVMIDVEVDGERHQEMHVDGGALAQVFLYPSSLNIDDMRARAGNIERERHLYVIRNARLDPDWSEVDRTTVSIATRAISTLIQAQGIGDLYKIYVTSQRDGIDYNLAYIPETFRTPLEEPFQASYMRALFSVGRDLGREGYVWNKTPPGFKPGG